MRVCNEMIRMKRDKESAEKQAIKSASTDEQINLTYGTKNICFFFGKIGTHRQHRRMDERHIYIYIGNISHWLAVTVVWSEHVYYFVQQCLLFTVWLCMLAIHIPSLVPVATFHIHSIHFGISNYRRRVRPNHIRLLHFWLNAYRVQLFHFI